MREMRGVRNVAPQRGRGCTAATFIFFSHAHSDQPIIEPRAEKSKPPQPAWILAAAAHDTVSCNSLRAPCNFASALEGLNGNFHWCASRDNHPRSMARETLLDRKMHDKLRIAEGTTPGLHRRSPFFKIWSTARCSCWISTSLSQHRNDKNPALKI
jgi:hypothetical protein